MEMFKFRNVLLAVAMVVQMVFGQSNMDIDGQFTCIKYDTNSFRLHLRVHDANGIAVRLHAINENNQTLSSCNVRRVSDTFEVFTFVTTTDGTETNPCGVRTVNRGGTTYYSWIFKVFPYEVTSTVITKGTIMKVECPGNDLTNRHVETLANINVRQFEIRPALASQSTGVDSVAPNANIIYDINISPTSLGQGQSALVDAAGIYAYNCFTSTTSTMSNPQLMIDANGCRVTTNPYAPTGNFVTISNSDGLYTIQAQYGTAVPVQGRSTIYYTCQIGICLLESDPSCQNRCNAVTNSSPTTAQNTGVTLQTSLTIQEREAQIFEVRDSSGQVINSVENGDIITFYSTYTTSGTGLSNNLQDFRNAEGFFNKDCEYAFNANFNDAVQFIQDGCPVDNDVLSFTSTAFAYDPSLSIPASNIYVLKTGPIIVTGDNNGRLWIRCETSVCLSRNHEYCDERCGAVTNNLADVRNLGNIRHITDFSLLNVNLPFIDIVVTDDNGEVVSGENTATVGEQISVSVIVTPGGQGDAGNAFEDAEGIYLFDCYMIDLDNNNEQIPFIDENGCRIPDSPFVPTQECVQVSDNPPPFEISCGTVTVAQVGRFEQRCRIGLCSTPDHPRCLNRCAAGPNADTTGISEPAGLQATSPAFQSGLPDDDDNERTAIKAKELDDLITALAVVGAVVLLAAVATVTYLIIRQQRKKAKKRDDDRNYNY